MCDNNLLFDISELTLGEAEQKFRPFDTPIWTKNKAHFIARYLKSFTYVTKHGTYIDAFAGPQHKDSREESWAVKLVMENEPAWLRKFYLFDEDQKQIEYLHQLRKDYLSRHPDKPNRIVIVKEGDCNITLPQLLKENPIREREASFCLLDQWITECDWNTVTTVAKHKGHKDGKKIELFYFLPQGWIDRAIKSRKKDVVERHKKWWGNDGVMNFLKLNSYDRGRAMAERFRNELGYKHAFAFPIQKEGLHGRIMFWMIHATDHDRAPVLMMQAYNYIGAGRGLNDEVEQLLLNYDD